jgi:hypothetical protein
MFFREKKTSKHPVLQLVENQRNANGKVSQRIVVSLGGCCVPDEYRKAVAIEVTHRMAGYQRILPLEDPMALLNMSHANHGVHVSGISIRG